LNKKDSTDVKCFVKKEFIVCNRIFVQKTRIVVVFHVCLERRVAVMLHVCADRRITLAHAETFIEYAIHVFFIFFIIIPTSTLVA